MKKVSKKKKVAVKRKVKKKKVVASKKKGARKAVKRTRSRSSAKSVVVKKRVTRSRGVPVGFSISKHRDGSMRAWAYDERNGEEVLLRDVKYIPMAIRRELTAAQIAEMLLTDDAKQ